MRPPLLALATVLASSFAAAAAGQSRPARDACIAAFAAQAQALLSAHQAAINSAPTSSAAALKALGSHDQAIRAVRREALQTCGLEASDERIQPVLEVMHRIDAANQGVLKAVLKTSGWPTRSDWGSEVADAAFLIVQHADQDPALQERGLALLEPLVAKGAAAPDDFALLFDRVRVNANKPQRYGTQGACQGKTWRPDPLEDAAHVDALRAKVGLEPLSDYAKVASQLGCQHGDGVRAKPPAPKPARPNSDQYGNAVLYQ